MHQVACGKLAKAEVIVGLLCAMAQATGKDFNIKGMIAEAMWTAESVRAFRFQAESQAHEDRYDDVARYFQTVNMTSEDRIALFRLAHDVAVSGFRTRQVLYERFFFPATRDGDDLLRSL